MTQKHEKKKSLILPDTFGDVTKFKVLEFIAEKLNELPENKKRLITKYINKCNKFVSDLQQIADLEYRLFVKNLSRDHALRLLPELKIPDPKLESYIRNYIVSKFSNYGLLENEVREYRISRDNEMRKISLINNIKLPPYNIFGSASSKDYDVVFYVEHLGTIDNCHKVVKQYQTILEHVLFDIKKRPRKVINGNLAVLDTMNGTLVKVFKGTPDEVNNSVHNTYHFHTQDCARMISTEIKRGGSNEFYTHLKIKRCFRFILSFYSRVATMRSNIKIALKGDINQRIAAVDLINFVFHTEFPDKKELKEDIYKVIAFQLAQTTLLHEGIQIFTKEEVIHHYPGLKHAILREPLTNVDLRYLTTMLKHLIEIAKTEIPNMQSLNEEIL